MAGRFSANQKRKVVPQINKVYICPRCDRAYSAEGLTAVLAYTAAWRKAIKHFLGQHTDQDPEDAGFFDHVEGYPDFTMADVNG